MVVLKIFNNASLDRKLLNFNAENYQSSVGALCIKHQYTQIMKDMYSSILTTSSIAHFTFSIKHLQL